MRVARRFLNKKSGINLDGLISYWKLNGDGLDSYGDNHGVILPDSYFQPGKYNEALVCGTNTMGMEVDGAEFSFTDGDSDLPFSINFWVYLNANGDYWFVSKRDGGKYNIEYQIIIYKGKLSFYIFGNDTDDRYITVESNSVPALGEWVMITATYNGVGNENGGELYINGNNVTDTRDNNNYTGMVATSSLLTFGNPKWISGFNLNGMIDDISVWSVELTPDRVLEIYNLQKELL
jgi:hypothetical protein